MLGIRVVVVVGLDWVGTVPSLSKPCIHIRHIYTHTPTPHAVFLDHWSPLMCPAYDGKSMTVTIGFHVCPEPGQPPDTDEQVGERVNGWAEGHGCLCVMMFGLGARVASLLSSLSTLHHTHTDTLSHTHTPSFNPHPGAAVPAGRRGRGAV